jgi:hypothetical protein
MVNMVKLRLTLLDRGYLDRAAREFGRPIATTA